MSKKNDPAEKTATDKITLLDGETLTDFRTRIVSVAGGSVKAAEALASQMGVSPEEAIVVLEGDPSAAKVIIDAQQARVQEAYADNPGDDPAYSSDDLAFLQGLAALCGEDASDGDEGDDFSDK